MDWLQQPKIKLEIKKLEKDHLEFILSNCDISIANALRRIMIAEVPTMAIDLVTIYENTSVLHDEYICHRLGLIPIDSRYIEQYNYRDECDCMDQCPKCCIDYTLDVTCTSNESLNVTHMHIYPEGDPDRIPTPARLFGPGNEEQHIMILKLRKNQTIKAKLTASKGIGKVHAKWIPVATAVYQLDRRLSINYLVEEKLDQEDKLEIAKKLNGALNYESDRFGTGKGRLVVADDIDSSLCELYESKAFELGYKNLLKVEEDETKFNFVVEGTGALPPAQIVSMALQLLEQKLVTISSLLKTSGRPLHDISSIVSANRPLYNLD